MHKFRPEWGTHLPVLIKVMQESAGPVLELGLGISSTPVLHAMCQDQNRYLISMDNDKQFIDLFKKYNAPLHSIVHVKDWDKVAFDDVYSVVLVDHKPEERRAIEASKLIESRFVILHDSEPENEHLYHYKDIYPLFKYRFDYNKANVYTTVLSNYHDLNFLHFT